MLGRPLTIFVFIVSLMLAAGSLPSPALALQPPQDLTLGSSTEGRPITALRIGSGPLKLVLVGDTHGGPEANTYQLSNQLADYFRANPAEVPASVSLYVIPTLNPDGLAAGSRFNAHGVDLNRNMNTSFDSCPENDWRITVEGAYGVVSDTGGPYADSEVESRLIRDFLLDASAVIFFHSNAGNVFPASCEHPPSIALAQTYAAAAGYNYARYWDSYHITGGMHDWAGSLGIAAIIPELVTGDQPEYQQNLQGVQAVLANADALLPPPADHAEAGIDVPALIWRFWKAYGGMERFGPPLLPASVDGGVTRQVFQRAAFEIHAEQANTPYLVQVTPLGRLAAAGQTFAPGSDSPDALYFPETGHSVRAGFRSFYEQIDGMRALGLPLSEEVIATAEDGLQRTVQYFERGELAYYPEDGSTRLEPLGWYSLVRQQLATTPLAQTIR